MRRTKLPILPLLRGVAAAAVVAALLPTSAPAAHSEDGQSDQSEKAVAPAPAGYGGFSTAGWATPVRVEVYEPSIPIPDEPQVELNLGYSRAEVDSGTSKGRASYFWPGGPVGEGLPTFGDQLGLPPELFEKGYPVQVNSGFPSDQVEQRDEPFPGMVMRTESADKSASAQTGFSPDGAVTDPDDGESGGDGSHEGEGEDPPVPGLPGIPGMPGTSATTAEETPGVPGLPAPLAAVVDLEGYVSTSRATAVDGPVVSASRAILGDVHLLGGILTLSGLDVRARVESDGATGISGGRSDYGTLTLAGQEFSIGPDGAIAGGSPVNLPGLPADPATALLQLGISIQVPEAQRVVEGDLATSVSQGLVVVIDTSVLAPLLQALPAAALAGLLPDDAGPLKSLLGGLGSLKPIIVTTLGIATASVDTQPAIVIEPTDPTDPTDEPTDTGGPQDTDTGPSGPGVDVPEVDAGPAPDTDASPFTPTAADASPGLPPLFSIPGMLMLAAFAGAAFAGSWFRRIGAAALGGGAVCPHGLDSGLPDLRKA
jgi:hypothetical protein